MAANCGSVPPAVCVAAVSSRLPCCASKSLLCALSPLDRKGLCYKFAGKANLQLSPLAMDAEVNPAGELWAAAPKAETQAPDALRVHLVHPVPEVEHAEPAIQDPTAGVRASGSGCRTAPPLNASAPADLIELDVQIAYLAGEARSQDRRGLGALARFRRGFCACATLGRRRRAAMRRIERPMLFASLGVRGRRHCIRAYPSGLVRPGSCASWRWARLRPLERWKKDDQNDPRAG